MKKHSIMLYISLICFVLCMLIIVSGCAPSGGNGPMDDSETKEGEEIDIESGDYEEDEEEPGLTNLTLTKDNYHYLGSTYIEMCDWHHGEADIVGSMQKDNCYYTSLTPNADLEMRRSVKDEYLQPDDYCFGINGWFERVFDAEDNSFPTIEEVINYFGAENVTTMDVTDELEAPGNVGTAELTCMDIELDTSSGRKKVRLEIAVNEDEGYISSDTWTRIYLLDE